jgi:hypothetical protein
MRRFITLLATLALALPATALAGDREDVERERACSGGSTVKLKLSEEDGGIEVELEVDQNRNGVRWQVTLRRNGKLVFRGPRVTRPPSGSFEVRRVLTNRPGPDRIVGRATSPSGEVCRISATW